MERRRVGGAAARGRRDKRASSPPLDLEKEEKEAAGLAAGAY